MSQIRKKSLLASIWTYTGFLIGALNTYFLTHKNWFSTDQNGLTRSMIEISQLIFAFSCLGTPTFLFKFFPYYDDNLPPKKNDILGLSLMIATGGFICTALGFYCLEPLVIKKFSFHSQLLVDFYFWILPMGFLVLLYNIFDTYSIGKGKGVLSSLLKETILRVYTLTIIVLKILGYINFETFVHLFSLQYLAILIILIILLKKENKLFLSFKISKVSYKYRKKILSILLLTFFTVIVTVLRQSIDGLVLAAKQNLGKVGIFGLASYMVSLIQVPSRGMIAVTYPILSRAWKDKNLPEIQRIYERTSINMLGYSLFFFFCIWLNFENGIQFLNINPDYLEGKWVFFMLGIVTIIELGTGVNGQIITTSNYWTFELWTSLLLTILIIPLSYILTSNMGIIGPAIANLISFSIYNLIRIYFLWYKFKMQPFSTKTIEVIIISLLAYGISFWLTKSMHGAYAIISSLLVFTIIYVPLFYWRNISPDVKQLMETMFARFKKNNN